MYPSRKTWSIYANIVLYHYKRLISSGRKVKSAEDRLKQGTLQGRSRIRMDGSTAQQEGRKSLALFELSMRFVAEARKRC